jgi:hypothetical protein
MRATGCVALLVIPLAAMVPAMRSRFTTAAAAPFIVAVLLAGCASGPAEAETDDKEACLEYARVISDWAVAGGSGETAATGVAIKLRTEVMPLAEEPLKGSIGVMADVFESYKGDDYTAEETAAGEDIVSRCDELGVNF